MLGGAGSLACTWHVKWRSLMSLQRSWGRAFSKIPQWYWRMRWLFFKWVHEYAVLCPLQNLRFPVRQVLTDIPIHFFERSVSPMTQILRSWARSLYIQGRYVATLLWWGQIDIWIWVHSGFRVRADCLHTLSINGWVHIWLRGGVYFPPITLQLCRLCRFVIEHKDDLDYAILGSLIWIGLNVLLPSVTVPNSNFPGNLPGDLSQSARISLVTLIFFFAAVGSWSQGIRSFCSILDLNVRTCIEGVTELELGCCCSLLSKGWAQLAYNPCRCGPLALLVSLFEEVVLE